MIYSNGVTCDNKNNRITYHMKLINQFFYIFIHIKCIFSKNFHSYNNKNKNFVNLYIGISVTKDVAFVKYWIGHK